MRKYCATVCRTHNPYVNPSEDTRKTKNSRVEFETVFSALFRRTIFAYTVILISSSIGIVLYLALEDSNNAGNWASSGWQAAKAFSPFILVLAPAYIWTDRRIQDPIRTFCNNPFSLVRVIPILCALSLFFGVLCLAIYDLTNVVALAALGWTYVLMSVFSFMPTLFVFFQAWRKYHEIVEAS